MPFPRTRFYLLLSTFCLLPSAFCLSAETLTLADCLRETADHNPQIVQQRYAVDQAFADRLTLRARALPIFTVGGIVGRLQQETVGTRTTVVDAQGQRTVVTTPTTDKASYIALGTETLYQPLFDAAIPASYRRGTANVIAAQQNFYAVATAELHLARQQFLQALYQQKYGEVLRAADTVLAANVQSQTQLVNAGLAGRAPLLSAQVQRANFDPNILSAAGTYRTTLAQLLRTMGRDNNGRAGALTGITLAGALDDAFPAFDAADATRRALDRRPDLKNLRALVRTLNEDANIAKGGYYPLVRIYLNGEYAPESNVRSSPNAVRASDQVNTTELRPGIQENWNIIDTGAVRGAVRGREAARDVVAISLARLERNIPSELAVVRTQVTDAASIIGTMRQTTDTAQNTLNIIQAGIAQGVNSQLEFLDAQNGIVAIRISLLAATFEMSLAHADFDRITGNYLQFVNDRLPEAKGGKSDHPAKK